MFPLFPGNVLVIVRVVFPPSALLKKHLDVNQFPKEILKLETVFFGLFCKQVNLFRRLWLLTFNNRGCNVQAQLQLFYAPVTKVTVFRISQFLILKPNFLGCVLVHMLPWNRVKCAVWTRGFSTTAQK